MHKKDKKKILSILVIPDNQEVPPKNFRIRYSTLNLSFAVLGIFFIVLIYGLVTYSQVLQKASEKDRLEEELVRLKDQMKLTYQLQAQLDTIQTYREKINNSFQGYVRFVDKVNDDLLTENKIIDNDLSKISIFTNVPLKIPVAGFISQEFKEPEHPGIDIVAKVGTPIVAAADGIVVFSGWTVKYGYVLMIHHEGGYLTDYRHNSQNFARAGQEVKQGEVIALLGNSGESSSGPHLHFEIRKDGRACNPREFFMDLTLGE